MTEPDAPPSHVTGVAAAMTILAMGLGFSISVGDPTILSANISEIRAGLGITSATASFVASLATLALAAAVLGAGALGDLHGKRRLFVIGLFSTVIFNLLAAAAPNGGVLMLARAGAGVGFALLLGLSLAIVNDVFPPERRSAAISLYLGTSFAVTAPQPAIGSLLAEHFGWRAGFLVAPVVALLTVAITVRFVPETGRSPRKLDSVGIGLVAVALLGFVYGVSRLESGLTAGALVPVAIGLVAAAAFAAHELRTPAPALDLRILRSRSVVVAVAAGITKNFLTGGCTILYAYYLVAIRDESPALLGLLLVPATILQAFAAIGSGRVAEKIGNKAVLVTGLALMICGLIVLTVLEKDSSIMVLFAALTLICLGGAVVQTPQSTIMMSSAPPDLSGAVSALKTASGQTGYSLGPTLFALIGTWLFVRDGTAKLAGTDVTLAQAREALRIAHGGNEAGSGGTNVLDPERAREVVAAATDSMIEAMHTLGLVMIVVPAAAIVLALTLLHESKANR